MTPTINPYKDSSTNLMYNLLFCDNLDLFKINSKDSNLYPWDILFSDTSTDKDLQKVIDDSTTESRMKILAYNRKIAIGEIPRNKELLGVIVEVGLDKGADVLASYKDGTARYINQTGKVLIWETTDSISKQLTADLFEKSLTIVKNIGPWDKARQSAPTKGNARITFLVSDGLYFGEGAINVLFNDPMASTAIKSATQLMQYLIEKSTQTS